MTEQPKSHEPAGKRESITDRPRPPAPEAPPPHSSDPYEITAEAIADPPHTFWGSLRQIGPGLILTASIVGTGELIATTNLGAKAGFALLWLVILSCFIKVFVQIELGRHTIASGETTLASFERVPGVTGLHTSAADGILSLSGTVEGAIDPFVKALAPYDVRDLSVEEPDLEESVLRLYGERAAPHPAADVTRRSRRGGKGTS